MAATQRQVGYNKTTVRSADDFYTTPPGAVEALLRCEKFSGRGWEPACGNGAISRYFPGMIASDIRTDPDVAGERGVDFLRTRRRVDYIVMNPPFSLALRFLERALECAPKVAMLNRLLFLEGIGRYPFFVRHPPARVHVFADRITCNPPGERRGNLVCYAWFVWQRGHEGAPTLDWIFSDLKKMPAAAGRRGSVRVPRILMPGAVAVLAALLKSALGRPERTAVCLN